MLLTADHALDFLQQFAARRECCQALLDLGARQAALIAAEDYPQLLELLGRKQVWLSRLAELGLAQPRLRERWQRGRHLAAPEVRESCEQVLAEAEAALARVLECENHSAHTLAQLRESTARQLAELDRGAQAQFAYRDALAPTTARHLDLDG